MPLIAVKFSNRQWFWSLCHRLVIQLAMYPF